MEEKSPTRPTSYFMHSTMCQVSTAQHDIKIRDNAYEGLGEATGEKKKKAKRFQSRIPRKHDSPYPTDKEGEEVCKEAYQAAISDSLRSLLKASLVGSRSYDCLRKFWSRTIPQSLRRLDDSCDSCPTDFLEREQ